MTNKLSLNEEPLPQDEMEGVDDDEWVSDERSRFIFLALLQQANCTRPKVHKTWIALA